MFAGEAFKTYLWPKSIFNSKKEVMRTIKRIALGAFLTISAFCAVFTRHALRMHVAVLHAKTEVPAVVVTVLVLLVMKVQAARLCPVQNL